jgi:signal transduction histidine kinase
VTFLALWARPDNLKSLFVDFVARAPGRVQTKLLIAFLTIAGLLLVVGAVAVRALSTVNDQTQYLIKLQHEIAAYRQVQQDTTSQLYEIANALLSPDDPSLDAALRQLKQFVYDFDRLEFVAEQQPKLIGDVRNEYQRLVESVTAVADLVRAGHVAEAREAQRVRSIPEADTLQRLINQLVNIADAHMVAAIDATEQAYRGSQSIVLACSIGSILLALALGYVISWSLIQPVKAIEARLRGMASGNFLDRVEVSNSDELGTLADSVNQTSRELGRLYHEINEKSAQLEAASRHKSQFLANMSHELRTPLNAILGYTELVIDGIYGDPPGKMREVLIRVEVNGKHLLGLINDVLDLAKIEAGELSLALADYSLPDIVQTVCIALEPLAAEKKIGLKVDLPADLPVGHGDERRLAQVLLNLVGNAIKFTEAGEVSIKATESNGAFEVAVSDTGPGIASSDQLRIFNEFQQVDDSSTRKKGGTGLGLSISRRIVQMHGGRIGVRSEPTKGSTFFFTVPVIAQHQAENA